MSIVIAVPNIVPPDEHAGSTRPERALRWPFVVGSLPLWWGLWAIGWWRISAHQLEHLGALSSGFARVAPLAAALAVLARFFGLLLEVAFYAWFWRTRGVTLPFWRYAFYVMLGSLADLQGLDLLATRGSDSALDPWRLVLIGPAAAPHAFAARHPVLIGAFAGLGLLALGRWCWVAWAQSQATARPLRTTLLLTVSMWLVTHLAAAAALALAQGRSVVP